MRYSARLLSHLFPGIWRRLAASSVLLVAVVFVHRDSFAQVRSDSLALTAQETATKLANPTAPLGRVTLQFKRWGFERNEADGARAGGYAVAFESSIPFSFSNGAAIRFRPNVPIYFQYPVVASSSAKIENRAGLTDITFDLAYGKRNASGLLLAFGRSCDPPYCVS